MNNDGDDNSPQGNHESTLQEQINSMQKLMETQLQMLQLQAQTLNPLGTMINNTGTSKSSNSGNNSTTLAFVRNVKVPEGRYDMDPNEYRTFAKDCRDYKKLTGYNDNQIVLQIRMNMDSTLKRAIDVNYKDAWDTYTVEEAITAVSSLL